MKRLSVAVLMLTALTGCTVTPGAYMSTSGKMWLIRVTVTLQNWLISTQSPKTIG